MSDSAGRLYPIHKSVEDSLLFIPQTFESDRFDESAVGARNGGRLPLRRLRVVQQRRSRFRRQIGSHAGKRAAQLQTVRLRTRFHGRQRAERLHHAEHRRQSQSGADHQREFRPVALVPVGTAFGAALAARREEKRTDLGRRRQSETQPTAADVAIPDEDAHLFGMGYASVETERLLGAFARRSGALAYRKDHIVDRNCVIFICCLFISNASD